MMTSNEQAALFAYRDALRDRVSIMRPANASTAAKTVPTVRAQVRGYRPNELGGLIVQGDMEVILFKPDMDAGGFLGLPKKGDKIGLVADRTLTVQFCDANTRRIGTTTIAYVCGARGS